MLGCPSEWLDGIWGGWVTLSIPGLHTASCVYPRVKLYFLHVVWHEVSEVLTRIYSEIRARGLGLLMWVSLLHAPAGSFSPGRSMPMFFFFFTPLGIWSSWARDGIQATVATCTTEAKHRILNPFHQVGDGTQASAATWGARVKSLTHFLEAGTPYAFSFDASHFHWFFSRTRIPLNVYFWLAKYLQ